MTSPTVATPSDLKGFVANQFLGETLLENYVMYSTPGSRLWVLPTLNMIAFIPMSLIQGCLSPVFGSISALKNVVFLGSKEASSSLSASFATSADCFKRIGQVFMQYITFSTPKHSDFWPDCVKLSKTMDGNLVFPTADATKLEDGTYSANRCIYFQSDLSNFYTFAKTMTHLAFLIDSHLLIFYHTMSRFETAIPEKQFIELLKKNTPLKQIDLQNITNKIKADLEKLAEIIGGEGAKNIHEIIIASLDKLMNTNSPNVAEGNIIQDIIESNGRGIVVELKAGTSLNNPADSPKWYSYQVLPVWYEPFTQPTIEELGKTLKGKLRNIECLKSLTENTTRLDEIKPCLSPRQRELIYRMILG